MGIRLSELKGETNFCFNTWIPFTKNINENLLWDTGKAAADAGMKEFIIETAGRMFMVIGVLIRKNSQWIKPVFDYINPWG